MMKRSALALVATTALCSLSPVVFAYGAEDFWVRAGAARIQPTGSDNHLNGSDIKVGNKHTGTAFTIGYRFTDTFGVELLAAPESFKHDVSIGKDGMGAVVDLLPPTLTAQYYPLGGTDSQVQPYIGAGVNYTRFTNTHLHDAKGNSLDEESTLAMKHTWGYALQAGVDFNISEHWGANLGVWYMDINSKSHLEDKNGQTIGSETKLHINPIVSMAGITYRF